MAIVVADGTGLNNADSYITTEFMVEFAGSIIGYTFPASLTETNLENLAKAGTLYLDGYDFKGSKLKSTQSLKFPRVNVGASGIPIEVKRATVYFSVHRQVHGFINHNSGSSTDLSNNSNRLITKRTRKIGEVTIQDEYSSIHNIYSISSNNSSNSVRDPSQESYISAGENDLRQFLLSGTYYFNRTD